MKQTFQMGIPLRDTKKQNFNRDRRKKFQKKFVMDFKRKFHRLFLTKKRSPA